MFKQDASSREPGKCKAIRNSSVGPEALANPLVRTTHETWQSRSVVEVQGVKSHRKEKRIVGQEISGVDASPSVCRRDPVLSGAGGGLDGLLVVPSARIRGCDGGSKAHWWRAEQGWYLWM